MRSTSELADALGLSRWTVSRVLNGHPGVRESTRQRVLQAIESSGFQPSILARGLRGGRTGLVGISFQEMDSPVRARKASVLQSQLSARGMRGIMELNSHDPALERVILRHFLDLKVDAIVLFGAYLQADDPLLAEILEGGPPLLVVDPPSALPVTTIGLDRSVGISAGLRHLHELGHRRFALVGLMHDAVYGPQRLAGLHSTARELGLDPQEAFVALNDAEAPTLDYASGSQLTQELLRRGDPPRAIIALNDCLAIGALHALRAAGWRVPEDFSVLGFDDIGVAAWVRPSLTTLSQEIESLSEAAVQWLEGVLAPAEAEKPPPRSTQLSPKLIVRESTGPAPVAATTS